MERSNLVPSIENGIQWLGFSASAPPFETYKSARECPVDKHRESEARLVLVRSANTQLDCRFSDHITAVDQRD